MGREARSRAARRPDHQTRIPLVRRPGAVCVVSGDRTSHARFAASLATLVCPPGTRLHWRFSGGGGVAMARNEVIQQALDGGAEWVLLVDDDHVFRPDLLARLLRHDRDLVVPTVLGRWPPHELMAWPDFAIAPDASDDELGESLPVFGIIRADVQQDTGLMPIGAAATACVLIGREVLDAMPHPWFEFGRLGDCADYPGEDAWFFGKALRLGFKAYCDLDTSIGHMNTCAIWPVRDAETGALVPHYEFIPSMECELPAKA
jgi:GT2 family glycosyltransferase